MSETKEWKLVGHSYQIADTGDYDGSYEITNGKISILTKDDDEEALQPIVDALNDSGAKFYLDDYAEFELRQIKSDPMIAQAPAMFEAMQSFINDFERDHITKDGRITFNPPSWLLEKYRSFQQILAAARGETFNQPQG